MNAAILKVNSVTKKYKNVKVLGDINLTLRKGQIYGLIGLNGAGKSTLIRVITGLSNMDSGTIELFGDHEKAKVEENRRRIGAIVETPALYEDKTVYQNMHINRIQKGIPGEECIEKTLSMLGISEIKNKKVKSLSLGTRQIAGIGMALMGEPELLILDEPINGLDPIKIIEVRELLKKLNQQYGTTILISSHILNELHNVANYYGIIHKGKLIEEISAEELDEKCKNFIHIKTDNAAVAAVIINKKLNTSKFDILPDNIIRLYDYVDDGWKVTEALVKEGVRVKEIMPMGEDIEAYFTKAIGGYNNV